MKNKKGGMIDASAFPLAKMLPKTLAKAPTNGDSGGIKEIYNDYSNLANNVNSGHSKIGYYTTFTGGKTKQGRSSNVQKTGGKGKQTHSSVPKLRGKANAFSSSKTGGKQSQK